MADPADIKKWKNKEVQDIPHYLSADQREILISDICGKCFDEMLPKDDDEE